MKALRSFGVLLAAIAITGAAACGGFVSNVESNKIGRQVESFEKVEPDAEALGRGDPKSSLQIVANMESWGGHVSANEKLNKADRERVFARLWAARRRYLLAAADKCDTPDLAFFFVRQTFTDTDKEIGITPEVRAAATKYSKQRGEARQKRLPEDGTYAFKKNPGACVFSSQKFGAEGAKNPGLSFYFSGKSPVIHGRCYAESEIRAMQGAKGQLEVVARQRGTFESHPRVLGGTAGYKAGQHYVDFTLEPGAIRTDLDFSDVEVAVSFTYFKDNIVVWENGKERVRAEYGNRVLAQSFLYWESQETAAGP